MNTNSTMNTEIVNQGFRRGTIVAVMVLVAVVAVAVVVAPVLSDAEPFESHNTKLTLGETRFEWKLSASSRFGMTNIPGPSWVIWNYTVIEKNISALVCNRSNK